MSFLDVFRKKWRHSNADIRLQAVDVVDNVDVLERLACHDEDDRVRQAAVEKALEIATPERQIVLVPKLQHDATRCACLGQSDPRVKHAAIQTLLYSESLTVLKELASGEEDELASAARVRMGMIMGDEILRALRSPFLWAEGAINSLPAYGRYVQRNPDHIFSRINLVIRGLIDKPSEKLEEFQLRVALIESMLVNTDVDLLERCIVSANNERQELIVWKALDFVRQYLVHIKPQHGPDPKAEALRPLVDFARHLTESYVPTKHILLLACGFESTRDDWEQCLRRGLVRQPPGSVRQLSHKEADLNEQQVLMYLAMQGANPSRLKRVVNSGKGWQVPGLEIFGERVLWIIGTETELKDE